MNIVFSFKPQVTTAWQESWAVFEALEMYELCLDAKVLDSIF